MSYGTKTLIARTPRTRQTPPPIRCYTVPYSGRVLLRPLRSLFVSSLHACVLGRGTCLHQNAPPVHTQHTSCRLFRGRHVPRARERRRIFSLSLAVSTITRITRASLLGKFIFSPCTANTPPAPGNDNGKKKATRTSPLSRTHRSAPGCWTRRRLVSQRDERALYYIQRCEPPSGAHPIAALASR